MIEILVKLLPSVFKIKIITKIQILVSYFFLWPRLGSVESLGDTWNKYCLIIIYHFFHEGTWHNHIEVDAIYCFSAAMYVLSLLWDLISAFGSGIINSGGSIRRRCFNKVTISKYYFFIISKYYFAFPVTIYVCLEN